MEQGQVASGRRGGPGGRAKDARPGGGQRKRPPPPEDRRRAVKECEVCRKMCEREDVAFVPDGSKIWLAFDKRPVGPAKWRIGAPHWGKLPLAGGEWACWRCRGVARPSPPPPLWRQARDAWATCPPELAKFAPRRRRVG